jgi:uncharacterized membrane protein YraQ (UPF0718 family)
MISAMNGILFQEKFHIRNLIIKAIISSFVLTTLLGLLISILKKESLLIKSNLRLISLFVNLSATQIARITKQKWKERLRTILRYIFQESFYVTL